MWAWDIANSRVISNRLAKNASNRRASCLSAEALYSPKAVLVVSSARGEFCRHRLKKSFSPEKKQGGLHNILQRRIQSDVEAWKVVSVLKVLLHQNILHGVFVLVRVFVLYSTRCILLWRKRKKKRKKKKKEERRRRRKKKKEEEEEEAYTARFSRPHCQTSTPRTYNTAS